MVGILGGGEEIQTNYFLCYPTDPSYLTSRLLGYVTIG